MDIITFLIVNIKTNYFISVKTRKILVVKVYGNSQLKEVDKDRNKIKMEIMKSIHLIGLVLYIGLILSHLRIIRFLRLLRSRTKQRKKKPIWE